MNQKFIIYTVPGMELLTEGNLRLLVSSFYNNVFTTEEYSNKILLVQLALQENKLIYKNLCKLSAVTSSDKDREKLTNYLIANLRIRYESYLDLEYHNIGIRYRVASDNAITESFIPPVNDVELVKTNIHPAKLNTFLLPPTMDLSKWSNSFTINNSKIKHFILGDYQYSIETKGNSHYIKVFDISNNLVTSVIDNITSKDKAAGVDKFTRLIVSSGEIFTYINGEQTFSNRNKISKFIPKVNKDKNRNLSIITMDLETRILPTSEMEVVSVAWYNGEKANCLHITDNNMDSEKLIYAALDQLFIKENDAKLVYLHNLSNFDGIFLLTYLAANSSQFKIVKREDSIIKLTVKYNDVTLHFIDSYLLLPSSLDSLGKSFNVSFKGSFDFNLLKVENNLFIYKEELMEYNKQDCIVLYEVLNIFSKEIFNMFKLNITKYPTLPSLAFAIYRSKFMKKEIIPITDYAIYKDIASGYTGGHVDVYKPAPDSNQQVISYDVNSLYPSVMKDNEYPVGRASYFLGHKDLNDLYGIIQVEVDCPLDIKVPFLMTHRDGRAIAPVGKWTDWYFSEELKYAATLGYKFKILSGYTYSKGVIFKEYVDTLYENRLRYPKTDPRNLISKLLLNSLYGRFGMKPEISDYTLIEAGNYPYGMPGDIVELGDKELISYNTIKNQELGHSMIKISLPIAIAITAYARISMYAYKAFAGDDLLYTDTDSIFTTKELPAHLIDSKALGAMKFEYKADKAVFLAPKVYAVIKDDGSELVKVKGSKISLTYKDLESLLDYDSSLELSQDKWFKSLVKGNISIRQSAYTLKVTANKRRIIYKDNKFIATLPIVLE